MIKTEEKLGALPVKAFVIGSILVLVFAFIYGGEYSAIGTYGYNLIYTYPGDDLLYTWNVNQHRSEFMRYLYAMGGVMATMFFILLVNRVKHVLSKLDVLIILIMVYTASPFLFGMSAWGESTLIYLWPAQDITAAGPTALVWTQDDADLIWETLPSFYKPTDYATFREYWSNVRRPWYPINWSMIIGTSAAYVAFFLPLALSFVFLGLLFRRLYVNVEVLPFPTAEIMAETVEITQPGAAQKGKPLYRNMWFIIPLIIQFVWLVFTQLQWAWGPLLEFLATGQKPTMNGLGIWGSLAAPRFGYINGPLLGYPVPPEGSPPWTYWGMPNFDVATLALLPWVPLMVWSDPWIIGWGLLLPLDVLIGAFIGFLFFALIYPLVIASELGSFTPNNIWYSSFAWYQDWWFSGARWNLSYFTWTNYGALFIGIIAGLAIVPIWRNRSVMGPILRSITGREPPTELDPDRPIPYKYAWWGLIIISLITIASATFIWQLNPVIFTVLFALVMFMAVGVFRWVAETGGYFGMSWPTNWHTVTWFWFFASLVGFIWFGDLINTGLSVSNFMTVWMLIMGGFGIFSVAVSAGLYTQMASKTTAMTGGRFKDVFKAIVIAIILTICMVSVAGYIQSHWVAYAHANWTYETYNTSTSFAWTMVWTGLYGAGIQKDLMAGTATWGRWVTSVFWPYVPDWYMNTMIRMPFDLIMKVIIGVAVVFIFFFLRGRYPWLRVSISGILLGLVTSGTGIWLPFMIAMIVKYLAIRIGGAEVYINRLRPMALGFIFGIMLQTFWWYLGAQIWYIIVGSLWEGLF